MKIIRRSAFETNSSSCHSLTLGSYTNSYDYELPWDNCFYLQVIPIFLEDKKYESLQDKLDYLTTFIATKVADEIFDTEYITYETIKNKENLAKLFLGIRNHQWYKNIEKVLYSYFQNHFTYPNEQIKMDLCIKFHNYFHTDLSSYNSCGFSSGFTNGSSTIEEILNDEEKLKLLLFSDDSYLGYEEC